MPTSMDGRLPLVLGKDKAKANLSFVKKKKKANLSQLDDPWDLPPEFILRKGKYWKGLRTYSGYWKEKEEERIAIRSAGDSSSSSSSASPSYVGLRKTLEFYLSDGTNGGKGTRTDWVMHEYHDLHKENVFDFQIYLIYDVFVLRKVFKKCKNKTDQVSSVYPHIESCVKELKQKCEEELSPAEGDFLNIPKTEPRAKFECQQVHKDSGVLDEDLGVQNEDLGADCDQHGQSVEVWKHFTKIRSTNDPNEVYAACHRCDKVLKAHPKRDGTSHLRRHFRTCSSCCNPSTDEDREILHRLRTVLDDPYKQQKMDEKLDCQQDLTKLDPKLSSTTYVTRSLNRQTQGGYWEEINKEFTAIRMEDPLRMQWCWEDIDKEISVVQMDHQFQVQVPQYLGLRRTLQFVPQEDSEMNWIMLEYQQLDNIESSALLLQEAMVIRKVFHYDKDEVTSKFIDLNRKLQSEEYYYKGERVNMSTDYKHGGGDKKRKRSASSKRTSEVWMYFTEIRTADHNVVHAVCHNCNRRYSSARSTNGTSHLWRHKRSCTSKPPGIGDVSNGANAAGEADI